MGYSLDVKSTKAKSIRNIFKTKLATVTGFPKMVETNWGMASVVAGSYIEEASMATLLKDLIKFGFGEKVDEAAEEYINKQTLSDIFSELKDPEWIRDREECWQLALDKGDWKSEYRKKDLEKIKHYFFTGEILEGFPFSEQWLRLLKLFPIQTKAGYDYYYQTHDFTESQLESNVNSAFLDQQTAGMRCQE